MPITQPGRAGLAARQLPRAVSAVRPRPVRAVLAAPARLPLVLVARLPVLLASVELAGLLSVPVGLAAHQATLRPATAGPAGLRRAAAALAGQPRLGLAVPVALGSIPAGPAVRRLLRLESAVQAERTRAMAALVVLLPMRPVGMLERVVLGLARAASVVLQLEQAARRAASAEHGPAGVVPAVPRRERLRLVPVEPQRCRPVLAVPRQERALRRAGPAAPWLSRAVLVERLLHRGPTRAVPAQPSTLLLALAATLRLALVMVALAAR